MTLTFAGLFAGIGGIELGLHRAGHVTGMLCECWEPAQAVLRSRPEFAELPIHGDVTTLQELSPDIDGVAAGFPCTDLSQAGRTAGIQGGQSGLVAHVFKLLRAREDAGRPLTWVLIENVQNMLALDRGGAMSYLTGELEALGCRWAYRVVDSRFTGVPQRRRRVILLASPTEDPRSVLFADEAGDPPDSTYDNDTFGFYWTEGLRGLGWARDAVPTLKGGSTVGIPSPPAIWFTKADLGRRIVTPGIEDAEVLQGFPRGWTLPAQNDHRNGPRWKLVGNAVTVGVSEWVGQRLQTPGRFDQTSIPHERGRPWPAAAWGESGHVWRVHLSEFPLHRPYRHLSSIVRLAESRPLSHRASAGFWSRLSSGNLGQHPGFRAAVAEHVEATR